MSADPITIVALRAVAEARPTRPGAAPTWRRDIPVVDEAAMSDLAAIHGEAPRFARLRARFDRIEPRNAPPFSRLAGIDIYAGADSDRDHLMARFAIRGAAAKQVSCWREPATVPMAMRERQKARKRLEAYGAQLMAAIAERPDLAIDGAKAAGACMICGRGLSDPISIARGIGSECIQGATFTVRDPAALGTHPFVIIENLKEEKAA